jgi:plastocyanin/predicted lipoprotein with Yx(FWY)xxD motif
MAVGVVAGGVAAATTYASAVTPSPTPLHVHDFAFGPTPLIVRPGTTVRITSSGPSTHTWTSDTTSMLHWDSGPLSPSGGMFAVRFSTIGRFTYHCKIHPFMTGTIVVANPPGAPAKPLAVRGNAQATLHWIAPANNGAAITSYVITPFLTGVAQPARTYNTAATTDVIAGLTNGKTYTFTVAARNGAGLGGSSVRSNAVQPSSAPSLRLASNMTIGHPILVDASGMTVYLFVPDGNAVISKVPPAIKPFWPAVAWSGTATVGAGLDHTKLKIRNQPNGTPQLAYNSHLLYLFTNDHKPGDATGQGVANFSVLSAAGNKTP